MRRFSLTNIRTSLATLLTFLAALLLAGGTLTACASDSAQRDNATADDLVEETGKWVGKTVDVEVEIEDYHGPYAFMAEAEDNFFDNDILIIVPNGDQHTPKGIENNDNVRVIGTVEAWVQKDIDEKYEIGWDWEGEYKKVIKYEETTPVIIAESVTASQEVEMDD